MPIKQTISYNYGTFFMTFTCYQWLTLIDKVNGYVIMPNHVHALLSFTETLQSINTIVGNGKRFMAYEIIKRLQTNKETDLLLKLSSNVEAKRKANNKKHEVWEL